MWHNFFYMKYYHVAMLGSLTNTAEKHGKIHDADGPPPTAVIPILDVLTMWQQKHKGQPVWDS